MERIEPWLLENAPRGPQSRAQVRRRLLGRLEVRGALQRTVERGPRGAARPRRTGRRDPGREPARPGGAHQLARADPHAGTRLRPGARALVGHQPRRRGERDATGLRRPRHRPLPRGRPLDPDRPARRRGRARRRRRDPRPAPGPPRALHRRGAALGRHTGHRRRVGGRHDPPLGPAPGHHRAGLAAAGHAAAAARERPRGLRGDPPAAGLPARVGRRVPEHPGVPGGPLARHRARGRADGLHRGGALQRLPAHLHHLRRHSPSPSSGSRSACW